MKGWELKEGSIPSLGGRTMIDNDELKCDFCGKNDRQVDYLLKGIANPDAYICNECIDMGTVLLIEQRLPRLREEVEKLNPGESDPRD